MSKSLNANNLFCLLGVSAIDEKERFVIRIELPDWIKWQLLKPTDLDDYQWEAADKLPPIELPPNFYRLCAEAPSHQEPEGGWPDIDDWPVDECTGKPIKPWRKVAA